LTTPEQNIGKTDVVDRARQQLARECPCAFYFQDIDLEFDHGVLTVYGTVPTYTLRSLLETMLSHVDGVKQIDNRVSVVSSTGLSSVCPK
jgi:hypothetical protein